MIQTLRVTPAALVAAQVDIDDIDAMVTEIISRAPQRISVGDFDYQTAAAIADRVVARASVRVHVEGSGIAVWPTPKSAFSDLMGRLKAPGRH